MTCECNETGPRKGHCPYHCHNCGSQYHMYYGLTKYGVKPQGKFTVFVEEGSYTLDEILKYFMDELNTCLEVKKDV